MCGSEVGEGGVASLAVRAATPELFVGEGAEPAWSVRLHSSQRDACSGWPVEKESLRGVKKSHCETWAGFKLKAVLLSSASPGLRLQV